MSGTNHLSPNRVHTPIAVSSQLGDKLQNQQDVFADLADLSRSGSTPDFASFLLKPHVSQKQDTPYQGDVEHCLDDLVVPSERQASQQGLVQHRQVGADQPKLEAVNLTELSANDVDQYVEDFDVSKEAQAPYQGLAQHHGVGADQLKLVAVNLTERSAHGMHQYVEDFDASNEVQTRHQRPDQCYKVGAGQLKLVAMNLTKQGTYDLAQYLDALAVGKELQVLQTGLAQHDGTYIGQPETLILNPTELSAHEQLYAVRFDSGSLFGHATTNPSLENQPKPANLTQVKPVGQFKGDPPSTSQRGQLRHSQLNQLQTQLASDQKESLRPIGVIPSENTSYSQYAQYNEASSNKANTLENGEVVARLRSLPRSVNKFSQKILAKKMSAGLDSEAHGLAEANAGDAPGQAPGSRDSGKTPKSAASLLASLRAATNPTWVAVQNIEQGIRVLARTIRLDPQVRDQLNLDMKTVLAQHGFRVGAKDIVISEHRFASTKGGSLS
jgi:uncharacterized protein YdbL (DUF1318 family)